MIYNTKKVGATWSDESADIAERIKLLLQDYIEVNEKTKNLPSLRTIYLYSVDAPSFEKHAENKYNFNGLEFYVFPTAVSDNESNLNVIFKGGKISSLKEPISAFTPQFMAPFIRTYLRDVAKVI